MQHRDPLEMDLNGIDIEDLPELSFGEGSYIANILVTIFFLFSDVFECRLFATNFLTLFWTEAAPLENTVAQDSGSSHFLDKRMRYVDSVDLLMKMCNSICYCH